MKLVYNVWLRIHELANKSNWVDIAEFHQQENFPIHSKMGDIRALLTSYN